MKKIILITLVFILHTPLKSYSQDYKALMLDGFNLYAEGNLEYNWWSPDKSYMLDYYIEGFRTLKLETGIDHEIMFLPKLNLSWETNFGALEQEELLQVQHTETGLETAYKKFKLIAGFGETLADFNLWKSNSYFDISYSKETFFIQVSPASDNFYYAPYNSSNVIPFRRGDTLSMFTKFEEIDITFSSGGIAVLPFLFSSLFGGDVEEIMELDGIDTRLGGFYATFQKPYTVSQVSGYGSVSGDADYIYNTRFSAWGLVETYSFYSDFSHFTMKMNLGLARIKLQNDFLLEESNSPAFFYYKHAMELGFHIPFGNRVFLNFGGNFDWSFMWGGNYNSEKENIETSSFINSDMIFKIEASLKINI